MQALEKLIFLIEEAGLIAGSEALQEIFQDRQQAGFFSPVHFIPDSFDHDPRNIEVPDNSSASFSSFKHCPCFGLLFLSESQGAAKFDTPLMGCNLPSD